MSRYVDVDILINKMQERYNDLLSENGYYDNFTQGYEDALSEVENEPTADVRGSKARKMDWKADFWLCRLQMLGLRGGL